MTLANFTVRLQVRDSLGNLRSAQSRQIQVLPNSNNNPSAAFSVSTVANTVFFDASESADIDGDNLSFQWDFGNGISSVGPVTSHTFAPGIYVATLTVLDSRGGRDTLSQQLDLRPVADREVISLNFTGTSWQDFYLRPYEYAGAFPVRNWNNVITVDQTGFHDNFGSAVPVTVTPQRDRAHRNLTSPVNTGDARMLAVGWTRNGTSANYTLNDIPYPSYDLYVYFAGARPAPPRTVQIRVGSESRFIRDDTQSWNGVLQESTATSAASAEDGPSYVVFRNLTGATQLISFSGMNDPGPAGIQIVNNAAPNLSPTALFAMTPLTGTAPLEVSFDASESFDPDGTIVRYEWDFIGNNVWQDGTANETFVYLFPDDFQPGLRITDNQEPLLLFAVTLRSLEQVFRRWLRLISALFLWALSPRN
ncbi:MAG: PKD domain-containing protein [Verrucomicrobia bacterium]|nr:PKD domain-containing protein [Verrucomicrobiota bacterium]